jgi:hypothetical protein
VQRIIDSDVANDPDPALVSEWAVKKLVERGALSEPEAKDRVGELLVR